VTVPSASAGIFVIQGSEQTGPFLESQIKNLLITGHLRLTDLAWEPGRPDWLPVGVLLGFTDLRSPPTLRESPPVLPQAVNVSLNSNKRRWPIAIRWIVVILLYVHFIYRSQQVDSLKAELKQLGAFAESHLTQEYAGLKFLEAAVSSNPIGVLTGELQNQEQIVYAGRDLLRRIELASTWADNAIILFLISLAVAVALEIRALFRRRKKATPA
jgi:aryl carrier-like protein